MTQLCLDCFPPQSLANRIAAATAAAAQKAATSQGGSGQTGGDGKQAAAIRSVGRFPSIQSVIGPILGNLQLVVTNIHIRYEDDVAWPGHTLSVGVLLSRLAAQTVDEAGNPAWVAASLQQLLRKVRVTAGTVQA
jgi:vacuolar protein sorting-associated protein 13A/C